MPAILPPLEDHVTEPLSLSQIEDREFMHLVDFAVAYRNASLWAINEGILTRAFKENLTQHNFDNILFRLLYSGQAIKQDYGHQDPDGKKNIYVFLPTAKEILELTDSNSHFLEEDTRRITLEFEEQSLGKDRKSREALKLMGYQPLDQLTDKPEEWLKEIFDRDIWKIIKNQNHQMDKGGGYNPGPQ
jgi:hypothetical protein